MDHIFGRDHYRVIALIARVADLTPEEAGRVTDAWKRTSPADRARAWTSLVRTTTETERYQILAAASLARREALAAAHRMQQMDWAFWAAASDAAAAVAAGPGIGSPYQTLTAPLATVMPSLAGRPAPADTSAADVAAAGHGTARTRKSASTR
jgi:hypothetical protein